MKISDYLLKKQWARRTRQQGYQYSTVTYGSSPSPAMMKKPSGSYEVFSQDRFLDEIHSGSHIIFDNITRSMRPKYVWDEETGKNKLDGYEDVTRVAISWQEAIRSNKAATCAGNPPWIGNEGGEKDAEKVNRVKAECNVMNLRAAVLSQLYSAFGTGDGALYFFIEDGQVKWQCFSYENGDNCTETNDYENPNEKMGVRFFDFEGHDAVEFYRSEYNELYINLSDEDIEEFRMRFADAPMTKTEDGYVLVQKKKHGIDERCFCYFREDDIPSGPVQKDIEYWETLQSDCGENIKYYAYQILFLTGGAISLPNANFGGKVIGSKTSDGDAKILEPADASDTLSIGFKNTFNAICDGSKSVFIKPEDLKGQNDSGAYIANLYWPELQWATLFYARYHGCFSRVLNVVKKLVGLIEGDFLAYKDVRMSYEFEPYIPKNKAEQAQILTNAVGSGYLSVETATEEFDSANPLELERLSKEAEAKEQRALRQMERAAEVKPEENKGEE